MNGEKLVIKEKKWFSLFLVKFDVLIGRCLKHLNQIKSSQGINFNNQTTVTKVIKRRTKLQNKSKPIILIGYHVTCVYRLYNPIQRKSGEWKLTKL